MESHVVTSEHSTQFYTEFLLQHMMKMTVLFNQLCTKSGVWNPLKQKTWLMNKVLRQEPPWVLKMTGFQGKKKKDIE